MEVTVSCKNNLGQSCGDDLIGRLQKIFCPMTLKPFNLIQQKEY